MKWASTNAGKGDVVTNKPPQLCACMRCVGVVVGVGVGACVCVVCVWVCVCVSGWAWVCVGVQCMKVCLTSEKVHARNFNSKIIKMEITINPKLLA